MKLHDILGYTAFGLIFMWLMGWSILGALVSWQFGISITAYIAIPSAIGLPLFIVTLFLLVIGAGIAKYLDDKNGDGISKPINEPQNGTSLEIPQKENDISTIDQSHTKSHTREEEDTNDLSLNATPIVGD